MPLCGINLYIIFSIRSTRQHHIHDKLVWVVETLLSWMWVFVSFFIFGQRHKILDFYNICQALWVATTRTVEKEQPRPKYRENLENSEYRENITIYTYYSLEKIKICIQKCKPQKKCFASFHFFFIEKYGLPSVRGHNHWRYKE